MKLRHAAVVIALVLAMPALAHAEVDIDAMKAHETPAVDTAEAAQICSAVTLAFAMGLYDNPELTDRYVRQSQMWIGIAAGKSGLSDNDYLGRIAMADARRLAGLDAGTLDFYDDYCRTAAAQQR